MSVEPHKTALMAYLKSVDDGYYGKVLELRDAVKGWLAYIPETFPHYTRHTVEHSDEIVLQISKLLFKNDDPSQPIIRLSPVEAYIVIAAAYLHDAGMVSADKEKLEILTTNEEWKRWTTGDGGGAKRWQEIEKLRQDERRDYETRHFLADLQTRFLIAEFIRRRHHLRAADVIKQHQQHLGRFAFDDPMMQRTIAEVCVAHGLRPHELEDQGRYPDRRDIRGYAVNVRFLAILLRLGDLLDMSYDRACPLLLNAANPLPADSLAHWTQYQRIVHRLTSPDRIELTAECHNQEEHRVLQDWCQWIADEVSQAQILMGRVKLHEDWQPPVATLGVPGSTIEVKPAPNANYIPSNWTFELDHEAVLKILIREVYEDPLVFIRELIQNALDANRTQMYADLLKEHIAPPEYPTQVEEERRRRYTIRISLEQRKIKNELSGEEEERQVLVINDAGIGMDEEIIKRYFLQIGRSYYTTNEFQREFRFVPTSRFGVGFLSVFAVSDRVIVETYKATSPHRSEPIRLTLTGPRNYLLVEKGDKRTSGTRIEVLLREPIMQGQLTHLVTKWCRRVEFPVFVDDLGTQQTITAETPEQFATEMPDATEEGAKFIIRAFPVNASGIEGELYVFARVNNKGERWDVWSDIRYSYPIAHPHITVPTLPESLICLHGISLAENDYVFPLGMFSVFRARLDYRGDKLHPTVSRSSSHLVNQPPDAEILFRLEEILREHISTSSYAKGKYGWKYKQSLSENYPLHTFWASLPEMVPVRRNGQAQLESLKNIREVEVVKVILHKDQLLPSHLVKRPIEFNENICQGIEGCIMLGTEITELSTSHRSSIFRGRSITNIRWLPADYLIADWILGPTNSVLTINYRQYWFSSLPAKIVIGAVLGMVPTTGLDSDYIVFNSDHPFISWLIRVREACDQGQYGLKVEQFKNLFDLTLSALTELWLGTLIEYLSNWRKLPGLPEELYPPTTDLTPEMFNLSAHAPKA